MRNEGRGIKSNRSRFLDENSFVSTNAQPFILQMVALWSIILAFMVLIVSLCAFDDEMFKSSMTKIRKEFGSKNSSTIKYDVSERAQDPDFSLLQDVLLSSAFSDSSNLIAIVTNEFGVELLISTPIIFNENDSGISIKDKEYLDKFGSVFFSLPDWNIGVYCIGNERVEVDDQIMLNFERASAVARYLHTVCELPLERLMIWSSSFEYFSAFFPAITEKKVGNLVFLSLMKSRKKAKNA